MRLIELSSTRSSFKTVRFKRKGISLIVGRHTQTQESNIKSTYNGVGKSLLIALVHYCLGSNKNKQFESHLQGWDFTLTFEHNNRTFRVTRTVGTETLQFDDKEVKLKPYREALNELGVFQIPADVSTLTFRSLISYFIRPGRSSYDSPEAAVSQWTPYYRVLYQSFLLGLDYHRAVQKHDLKKKLDEQVGLATKYKQDKELREFYLGKKNAEMELASIRERISTLEHDLARFVVARDYSDREAAANDLRARIADLRNTEAAISARLSDIDLAMIVRPDVTPERVKRIFEEARVALPELVKRRLEDVDAFQRRLQENRLRRLEQEKRRFLAEERNCQEERFKLEAELDGLLQYLNAHRALDEYTENNRFLAELTAKARRIEDYVALLSRYTDEAQRIRAEMGAATVQTTEYLKEAKPHLALLMDTYRGFARAFYGDKAAGLSVQNNDNDDNQTRYNIEARIEHDAADGINSVRIFCFDITLLTLRQRHQVDFLFHDSRLFADMDPHQRFTLFSRAQDVCCEHDLQYVATVNEDQIESLRAFASADFDLVFDGSRILELTDEPDGSGKLLGVQVEMKHEDE